MEQIAEKVLALHACVVNWAARVLAVRQHIETVRESLVKVAASSSGSSEEPDARDLIREGYYLRLLQTATQDLLRQEEYISGEAYDATVPGTSDQRQFGPEIDRVQLNELCLRIELANEAALRPISFAGGYWATMTEAVAKRFHAVSGPLIKVVLGRTFFTHDLSQIGPWASPSEKKDFLSRIEAEQTVLRRWSIRRINRLLILLQIEQTRTAAFQFRTKQPSKGKMMEQIAQSRPPHAIRLSKAKERILDVIRDAGRRLKTDEILQKLSLQAEEGPSGGMTKHHLAELVCMGLLTNRQDLVTKGYGLPEWENQHSGED